MTAAVSEALEALLTLRSEQGALTPADVADAVLTHDLDEAEAEALAQELAVHDVAPDAEDEPELDLSIGHVGRRERTVLAAQVNEGVERLCNSRSHADLSQRTPSSFGGDGRAVSGASAVTSFNDENGCSIPILPLGTPELSDKLLQRC